MIAALLSLSLLSTALCQRRRNFVHKGDNTDEGLIFGKMAILSSRNSLIINNCFQQKLKYLST